MKFTIPREALLKPLQLVTGVVERRQTLPVLANLLIQADSLGLSLTGTDLEVEMIARCEVPVEQPGEVTIPARKLADIWRALPDGADVSVFVESERATIRSGRSRFTLATLPAADFPESGEWRFGRGREPWSTPIWKANRSSQFCHGSPGCSCLLERHAAGSRGGILKAVATDGHRLAMASQACETNADSGVIKQAIVPRKAVMEMARLLDEEDETLSLQLGSNHLKVDQGWYNADHETRRRSVSGLRKGGAQGCFSGARAVIAIRSNKGSSVPRFYLMKNTAEFV